MAASASSVKNYNTVSLAMERTGHWVLSQDIPTDIVVEVGEATFALHKFMLVAKSNYFRKLVMESEERDLSRINLSAVPGGPETFEKAAQFCYGVNFEITVQNVTALRCAADYLEMTDDYYCDENLGRRTEEFLSQVALSSLPGAVAVLKSCQDDLLPFAENLKIVQRCVDVASIKACSEANFPSRSPPNWWTEELSILDVTFLEKIIRAMTARGAKTSTIATVLIAYSKMWLLRNLVQDHKAGSSTKWPSYSSSLSSSSDIDRSHQCKLLESIVALFPSDKAAFPIHFLCCLLQSAASLSDEEVRVGCRNELEKRISAILEHSTVDDLLVLSLSYDSKRLLDLESVKRILSKFVDEENRTTSAAVKNGGNAINAVVREGCSAAMQIVAKTVGAYLGQIATYPELSISMFNGIAILVPKGARTVDDDLYRAADIYLKAHPSLDEIEREKVCSVMDPLRLSYEARVHASQNKRLPVQVVLHALYYDQLKMRSGSGGGTDVRRRKSINMMQQQQQQDYDSISATTTMTMRSQMQLDVSLVRENEALRSELTKMKMYISDMPKGTDNNKVGTTTTTTTSSSTAIPSKKGLNYRRLTFFSSMSKTLGKLNPFRHGGSKDTSNIEDDAIDVTKPRRRRFSIS